jgi:hypothetical protein
MTKHSEADVRRAVEAMSPEERAILLTKATLKLQAQPGLRRSTKQAAFLTAAKRLHRSLTDLDADVKRSAPTTKAGRRIVAMARELNRALVELTSPREPGDATRHAARPASAAISPKVTRTVEAARAAMAELGADTDRLARGIADAQRGRLH